jgi:threonine aldolase
VLRRRTGFYAADSRFRLPGLAVRRREPGEATLSRNVLIDLYSDTQTKPSPGMRKAMAEAEVGDEQRGEDPSTNALQDRIAAHLGKEAAVFLPSGTMCNQIAMLVHCRPGDEIIGADVTHVFTSEAGGASALAGAQTWPIKCPRGIFTGADVKAALRDTGGRHNPRSRLVVIEQTVNRGGGAIWKTAEIEDVAKAAHEHGLSVHMDGARLLNAEVGAGVPAKTMTAACDTVWVDLSKGLGCPVGGLLAGPKAFIDEAWRWKHRLGGALRQSGVLAAAGLYALDNNLAKLAQDHDNAKRLGEHITSVPGLTLRTAIETNIVFFDGSAGGFTPRQIYEELLRRGVRMGLSYGGMIRAVTHLDVSREEIETAGKILREAVAALSAASKSESRAAATA